MVRVTLHFTSAAPVLLPLLLLNVQASRSDLVGDGGQRAFRRTGSAAIDSFTRKSPTALGFWWSLFQ